MRDEHGGISAQCSVCEWQNTLSETLTIMRLFRAKQRQCENTRLRAKFFPQEELSTIVLAVEDNETDISRLESPQLWRF